MPTRYFICNIYGADDKINFMQRISRMCNDYYLEESPKLFHRMKDFKFHKIVINGFVPKKYMHHHQRANLIEGLMCGCDSTIWLFTQQAMQNRPEIVNRKSNRVYPTSY
jgi:hypothetical protein